MITNSKSRIVAVLFTVSTLVLAGCQDGSSSSTNKATLSGTVMGGLSPIANATVNVYAAVSNADQKPISLGSAMTNAQGQFTLSYPVPALGSFIYAVAKGGNVPGGVNSNLVLVLGPESPDPALPSSVVVNELTTALSGQMYANAWAPTTGSTTIPVLIQDANNSNGLLLDNTSLNQVLDPSNGNLLGTVSSSGTGGQLEAQANTLALCVQQNMCQTLAGSTYLNTVHTDTFSLFLGLRMASATGINNVNTLLASATGLPYPAATNVVPTASAVYQSPYIRPLASTIDKNGNIWVINSNDSLIEIPQGSPTTTPVIFSGTRYGFDDPIAITANPAGNVWVANQQGGSGPGSVTEIPRGSATATPIIFSTNTYAFSSPTGITADSTGNIWVTNATGGSGTGSVTEIPQGSSTTTPVIFSGSQYAFAAPIAVTVDAQNNVWVSNYVGTNAGRVTEIPGGNPNSTPQIFSDTSEGQPFNNPTTITSDSIGNVWVANLDGASVVEIKKLAEGSYQPISFNGSPYNFDGPVGINVDRNNNVWIANFTGGADMAGSLVEMQMNESYSPAIFANNNSNPLYQFSQPSGISVDPSGNVWVANTAGNSVTEMKLVNGNYSPVIFANNNDQFDSPQAVFADSKGNIWVANGANEGSVTEIPLGNLNATPIIFSSAEYQFGDPSAINVDQAGNVWVANQVGDSVTEIPGGSPTATPVIFASGYQFNGPMAISIDANSDIWVANSLGDSITEIKNNHGNYSPIVFSAVQYQFSFPDALNIDNAGNVWVANGTGGSGLGSVTEIPNGNPNATPVIFAGSQYQFNDLAGIQADSAGNIWVLSVRGGSGDGSVTEIPQGNTNATPVIFTDSSYQFDGASVITSDAANNLWITNASGNSVTELFN